MIRSRSILVVDDNLDIRESLCELLRVSGHDVLAAADGEMALLIATRTKPDVVLLDLGLPDVDGHEVARRLRAAPRGEDIFVVAMTGYSGDEERERIERSGFDAYFLKGAEPEEMERLLASLPASRRPARKAE
jgi:CheY-like chemotaxis protein